jgi:T-complex protein 1 subunit eta
MMPLLLVSFCLFLFQINKIWLDIIKFFLITGGGAIEMEISKHLRDYSRTIAGKEQMILSAFARSFEIIPRQLCENAGFDATDILNKLRQKHSEPSGLWYGVDINKEDISDNYESTVWEPAVVKINSITAAAEAACLILSIDETIKAPRSGQGEHAQQAYKPGGGRPM